ncbi:MULTISPECIES: rhomboid family intramembrane serine protease [Paenibacillus]|jgi:rhomboid protease GluP|uniref:Membrane associated rhomboid family serine protease n=2 Tax=Paenibacillus TaxID=44249 RepID=A0ABS4RPV6_PAEXY|nr:MULTISPECIES: rhomboid family intramembrane serine protease [Paenibacillus]APO45032.1 rhomboid family intramembrane serine protease [Paenibacillus xylanexedens]ETT51091.1 rhomboid family protein [Paenibacillus sp. FSL H7-689]KAA8756135.1 rhomboid family intramembrane serine protease [Paenibacillus sp. UASWS1643]MBD8838208.1 rhomboid family intramembrane serine protease [Paenibacillus sp. CFBP 13594]MBP2244926.1 membrane associated rhomboid family serine protease [Paenibacillus xylanexedens]
MIFIRYENWKGYLKYFPLTSLFLIANVVMFIVLTVNGGSTNNMVLLKFGALTNHELFAHEWWRYITSMFLHAGFSHLLFNSFALIVFAPPMERLLGSVRYGVLYLGGGVLGNILAVAWYNSVGSITISVGASGAIYAVYGAFLYVALFQRTMMDEASRKTMYTLLLFGIIFSFAMSGINWMAHLGGLLGGFFIYGLLIRLWKPRSLKR